MSVLVTLPDGSEYLGIESAGHEPHSEKWLIRFYYNHVTPEKFHPEWCGQRVSVRRNYGPAEFGIIFALTDAERGKDNGTFSLLITPEI